MAGDVRGGIAEQVEDRIRHLVRTGKAAQRGRFRHARDGRLAADPGDRFPEILAAFPDRGMQAIRL